jgi:hypothetical protein
VKKLAARFAPPSQWGLRSAVWRRGFIETVGLVGGNLPQAGPVFEGNPVRRASVVRVRRRGTGLAGIPHLARLQYLEVGEVDGADLRALAGSPHLSRLEGLGLHGRELTDVLALAGSANLPPLTALQVGGLHWEPQPARPGLWLGLYRRGSMGPPDFTLLAASSALAALRDLRVLRGSAGEQGFLALARSPHLSQLTRLELPAVDVPGPAVTALLNAAWVPGLRALNLWGAGALGSEVLRRLAGAAQLAGLRELSLHGADPKVAGIQALAASAPLAGLTTLSLCCCEPRNPEALALAGAARLDSLTTLDLRYNCIGPKGLAALRLRFGRDAVRTEPALCQG